MNISSYSKNAIIESPTKFFPLMKEWKLYKERQKELGSLGEALNSPVLILLIWTKDLQV